MRFLDSPQLRKNTIILHLLILGKLVSTIFSNLSAGLQSSNFQINEKITPGALVGK